MGRVIAIDGPSGAGKSTIAKALAERLGFDYLDTGALYRAVALGLVRAGVTSNVTDERIQEALKGISVAFLKGRVFLNGIDVSSEIRTPEMGHHSSVFSARRPVREYLMPVQRTAAEKADLIAEGRDMTTVVFPDAWRKFYIDASMKERARRRYLQLKNGKGAISEEEAERDVVERDKRDSSRDIAPLRVADEAIYIDSSNLPFDETLRKVLRLVETGRCD